MPEPPPHCTTSVARLTTDESTAHRLQAALAECCDGEAVAVSIAQEAEGRWSLALHFRDRPDQSTVRSLIASSAARQASQDFAQEDFAQKDFAQALAHALTFETLAPTDWVRKSLEGLTPVEAGRFLVHGMHDRGRVGVNRIAIEIEASLAFGTGHHGSTRGCLLALDGIMKRDSRRRRTRGNAIAARRGKNNKKKKAAVLDIGTGTGVLAIAAAKALNRPVVASDIDRRAVTIARDNARINRVGSRMEIVLAGGVGARRFRERSPFSLIFANILLDPLVKLATPVAKLLAPNGQIVLAGLLNAQGAAAVACYRARGLALARRIALGGWTTLVLVRPSRVSGRVRRNVT
jgi:ribosomal protein L11 methyltransferase